MSENAPENDPNTENEPNTPNTENEPGQGNEAEYTAPDKDEWARVTSTLTKRKLELKTLRQEMAALKAKATEPAPGTTPTPGPDTTPAPPKADPDVKVKRLAVVAALAGEGLTKAQAKVAAKLVDLDDVEVDDDGDADLDDVIADLKSTFPAMFGSVAAPGGGIRPRTSGGRSREGEALTPDQKTDQAMLKAAGYR